MANLIPGAQLLYTSGRVPLVIRLILLPFAGLALCAMWMIARDMLGQQGFWNRSPNDRLPPVVVFLLVAGLFLMFLGPWLWTNWLVFDRERQLLVMFHRGFLGTRRWFTVPISEISHLEMKFGTIRATCFWDVSMVRTGGRRYFLTRSYVGREDPPPHEEVNRIARPIERPVQLRP
jgi:hypothetical protein